MCYFTVTAYKIFFNKNTDLDQYVWQNYAQIHVKPRLNQYDKELLKQSDAFV